MLRSITLTLQADFTANNLWQKMQAPYPRAAIPTPQHVCSIFRLFKLNYSYPSHILHEPGNAIWPILQQNTSDYHWGRNPWSQSFVPRNASQDRSAHSSELESGEGLYCQARDTEFVLAMYFRTNYNTDLSCVEKIYKLGWEKTWNQLGCENRKQKTRERRRIVTMETIVPYSSRLISFALQWKATFPPRQAIVVWFKK